MAKNYVGCCGYCKHMDLRSGYTSAYSTSFKCTRNNSSVKADEKSCNKFEADGSRSNATIATVYKGNIIKNLIMDCQSYTKYRPNETTGGIFVSWRRKEELPTGA